MANVGALLDAVRGVHWPARRAVTSGPSGAHHSTMRGTSAEFTEFRLYRQGDDPRRLDWRLLARSDRPYIRLATDRAVLPTTIALDASPSMDFPTFSRGKWEQARALAIGLAAVAHADGDPVGVVVASDGDTRTLPPRTRRGVVQEIARVLQDGDGRSAMGTRRDDADALVAALQSVRSARMAIITDLLGDAEGLLRAARVHLVAGGEVHLVHVVAREEIDPPRRAMLATDPEAPGIQRFLTDATRAAYLEEFGNWRAAMAQRWRAAGVSYIEVVDDEEPSHAVRRIVQLPSSAEMRA